MERFSTVPVGEETKPMVGGDGDERFVVETEALQFFDQITKKFVGRRPCTTMSLTSKGEKAFRRYVDRLEKIVFPRKSRKH